jgi:hypothetical protein
LQFEQRAFPQLLVQDAGELRLLALHAIGMPGGVGNYPEIELREYAVLFASILELRRRQASPDQRLGGAQAFEHVESGRMEGRGA